MQNSKSATSHGYSGAMINVVDAARNQELGVRFQRYISQAESHDFRRWRVGGDTIESVKQCKLMIMCAFVSWHSLVSWSPAWRSPHRLIGRGGARATDSVLWR